MAIRSGIGVGEAQIFDTSGVIGTYGRVLAQQQKNDERYASELADLISKVDTEGVREADLPEITKYYDAIKNTYRNALSTKNTTERAAYRAEIANGLNKLNNFANKSVEYKKGYTNLATEFAKNPWMIDSDKEIRLKKMASLPLTQLGEDAVIDPLRWMPKPDSSLLNTLFKDVEGELKKKAFERTPISSVAKDGVKYEKFGVKPEEADELIASRLKLSPKAEYSIRSLYAEANPTVTNPTDQDLIKFARTVYESQYGGKDAYTFGDRRSIPRSGGSDSSADSQKLTYRQQLITGLMNQDSDARQELLANLPANSKVEYSISRKVPGISKGGYKFVRLTIPAESTENGIEVREDIPLEAGKPIQKLNYIINQYSPEKISPSKVGIEGGKPRGEKFKLKEPRASNIDKTSPPKTNEVKGKSR